MPLALSSADASVSFLTPVLVCSVRSASASDFVSFPPALRNEAASSSSPFVS